MPYSAWSWCLQHFTLKLPCYPRLPVPPAYTRRWCLDTLLPPKDLCFLPRKELDLQFRCLVTLQEGTPILLEQSSGTLLSVSPGFRLVSVTMGLQPLLEAVAAVSALQTNMKVGLPQPQPQPQTPPGSTSGSPRIKFEGPYLNPPHTSTSLPGLLHLHSPRNNPQFKLPSLGEFDQGVEALVRTHGPVNSWTPPSPLPNLARNSPFQHSIPASKQWARTFEDPTAELFSPRRGTITSLSQYAIAGNQVRQLPPSYASPDTYSSGFSLGSPSLQGWDSQGMDCYPSPPPEGENRHINQKYTTEEGDFIIYAWHDKKMKWQRIKQEFAARFGRTPERTVQGLQAWYYRMNQRIPVWDDDGWLIFENDEEIEPKQIGIKCRERDTQDKPMEPLGLAQRYPERAVNYAWVDPELKMKARDWASKRAMQYRDRRERRRRKEQRRIKL